MEETTTTRTKDKNNKDGDFLTNNWDELLKKEEEESFIRNKKRRILSIQSHVVHGYVGNKSSVFPLQLLGYDVDIINSVSFSNHTGYSGGFAKSAGIILDGQMLKETIVGLQNNYLLSNIGYVITGYINTKSFLLSIKDILLTIRNEQKYQHHQQQQDDVSNDDVAQHVPPVVHYICDPVLGDNNKFYVPKELVNEYKEEILPISSMITPNQFELEYLSNVTNIRTVDDIKSALDILHNLGPSIIVCTSLMLEEDDDNDNDKKKKIKQMSVIASQRRKRRQTTTTTTTRTKIDEGKQQQQQHKEEEEIWRIDIPNPIPGRYTGTGDLCTALLLAHIASSSSSSSSSSTTMSKSTTETTEENSIDNNNELWCDDFKTVLEKVVSTMYLVILRTYKYSNNVILRQQQKQKQQQSTRSSNDDDDDDDEITKQKNKIDAAINISSKELRLIQSKNDIENPKIFFNAYRI